MWRFLWQNLDWDKSAVLLSCSNFWHVFWIEWSFSTFLGFVWWVSKGPLQLNQIGWEEIVLSPVLQKDP